MLIIRSALAAAFLASALPAFAQQPVQVVAGREPTALRPGDVVRLKIWREPDLSGDFTVDAAGAVTLPRLGTLTVTDLAPEALRARVVGEYQPFLKHSSIEVILQRRIRVSGAVENPGLYPVDPTMTISDVVALAGGASGQGKIDKVRLLRAGQRVDIDLSQHVQLSDLPLRSGDELHVPERSWLSRNSGLVIGAVGAVTSIVLLVR